jgi:hypothetical protein
MRWTDAATTRKSAARMPAKLALAPQPPPEPRPIALGAAHVRVRQVTQAASRAPPLKLKEACGASVPSSRIARKINEPRAEALSQMASLTLRPHPPTTTAPYQRDLPGSFFLAPPARPRAAEFASPPFAYGPTTPSQTEADERAQPPSPNGAAIPLRENGTRPGLRRGGALDHGVRVLRITRAIRCRDP